MDFSPGAHLVQLVAPATLLNVLASHCLQRCAERASAKKPRQARETISFVCLVLVTSFFAELASWFVDPVCVLAFCTLLAQNRGTGRRRVAVEILAKVAEEAVLVSWIRELALFACRAMRNVSVQGDVVRVVGEEFPGGAFSARGIPGV